MAEFPDIAWVYSGSGNDPYGDNAYWVDVYIHEPSYLAGIVAGSITETNVLGAVGAFPFPNVNIPLNAFLDGAQSVNPDVEMKVTYIESWFDPPKAKESALAQVAAGADIVYAERFGPFEACNEEGCLAFGHFLDQTSLAPEIVIGSPEARWDPNIVNIIDEWWNHVVDGVAYDAPMDRILFGFVDGGSDIAWNPGLMDLVPQEVWDEVETARLAILSGELIVELNEAPLGE
jgi:basic membrane lipoprotein Med (substrate-binding protein (PBP1-ABC) superfamily)